MSCQKGEGCQNDFHRQEGGEIQMTLWDGRHRRRAQGNVRGQTLWRELNGQREVRERKMRDSREIAVG